MIMCMHQRNSERAWRVLRRSRHASGISVSRDIGTNAYPHRKFSAECQEFAIWLSQMVKFLSYYTDLLWILHYQFNCFSVSRVWRKWVSIIERPRIKMCVHKFLIINRFVHSSFSSLWFFSYLCCLKLSYRSFYFYYNGHHFIL